MTQNERELATKKIIEVIQASLFDDTELAEQIASDLYSFGYRLIPELTVLKPEEIRAITFTDEGKCLPRYNSYTEAGMVVAQAQLNHTREQLKEG